MSSAASRPSATADVMSRGSRASPTVTTGIASRSRPVEPDGGAPVGDHEAVSVDECLACIRVIGPVDALGHERERATAQDSHALALEPGHVGAAHETARVVARPLPAEHGHVGSRAGEGERTRESGAAAADDNRTRRRRASTERRRESHQRVLDRPRRQRVVAVEHGGLGAGAEGEDDELGLEARDRLNGGGRAGAQLGSARRQTALIPADKPP